MTLSLTRFTSGALAMETGSSLLLLRQAATGIGEFTSGTVSTPSSLEPQARWMALYGVKRD